MTIIQEKIHQTRMTFKTGRTTCVIFRKTQLLNLLRFLIENRIDLERSLRKDIGDQTGNISNRITEIIKHLKITILQFKTWSSPQLSYTSNCCVPTNVKSTKHPHGIVLIISYWKEPFEHCFKALIGAISAGNCVILKLSDLTTNLSEILSEKLPQYLDSECYHVVIGGVALTEKLFRENFDYVYYSGNVFLSKSLDDNTKKDVKIFGKSPAFLDNTCDLGYATQNILFGKFSSKSIDYLICSQGMQNKFVLFARREMKGYNSNKSTKICSESHFWKLKYILNRSNVIIGGKVSSKRLCIQPSVIKDVLPNHPLMKEDDFGPILPIIQAESLEQVLKYVTEWEVPKCFHLFTTNQSTINFVLQNFPDMSISVNNVVLPVNYQKVQTEVFKQHLYFDSFSQSEEVVQRCYKQLFRSFVYGKSVCKLKKNSNELVETVRKVSLISVAIFVAFISTSYLRGHWKSAFVRVDDVLINK